MTNISFSKSDFSLSNFETNTTTYKKTQEVSSVKLLVCLKNYYELNEEKFNISISGIENCNLNNIKNIFKEFYKRFFIPFYIPLLTLIPLLLIISSKENSNYQKIKIFIFMIGMFAIVFSETTIRLVSDNFKQNSSLIIIPIIFISIIYLYLFLNLELKKL